MITGFVIALVLFIIYAVGGDLERVYRLHLPATYDSSRAASLVLHFHGYTGSATDAGRDLAGGRTVSV